MRQFTSTRVEGLEFTRYDDGSGVAEYKGQKVGEVDYNTNEIRLKDDNWRTIYGTDNLTDIVIKKTENYVLNNKQLIQEMAVIGRLDKAAAAELLLISDMITIAEISPYFMEDKKAAIKLDETSAEFLINKSPELKQAFEDKGYDNWKEFFTANRGEAFIEANDISDIGITVVINESKEYPIPLSAKEKNTLRDRLDEEVRRRNKEDMDDKDGDHIPDRIDSSYSSEGYRTQYDVDSNETYNEDYRIALVTSDEYNELKAKGFECKKAKTAHEDGRIPIRYKAAEKEKYKNIVNALGGKNGGIHI